MVYLVLGCRCMLFGVFTVAVAGKLRSARALHDFVWSIRELRLVRPRRARAVAIMTITAEAVTAVMLTLVPVVGFVTAVALLISFSATIVAGLAGGTRVPCQCFGSSSTPLGGAHLFRNAILLAAALTGAADSLIGHSSARTAPAGVALTVACASVVMVVVLFLDEFVAFLSLGQDTRNPS
ncbi:MauE/DoxX family redox-associated membrane protein [Spirillospora sp. NPDC052269]